MLITKEIHIQVKAPNITHFQKLGYKVVLNDKIKVPISHLKPNSHTSVLVQCDICRHQKEISYSKYNSNINRYGFYTCGKSCAIEKSKLTNLIKLGVDNPMKSQAVLDKTISNSIEKNGTAFYVQTESFKDKSKKTKKEKYGDENYSNKKQATETLLLNYDKTIATNQERYGCNTPFQNENVKQKIKTSKIKSGFQVSDEQLSAWQIYKRDIRIETYKFRKALFNNWDGYDYYDKEYIKDNLSLHYTNKNYPTVDHKISVHYGFLNNIPITEIGGISNLCITKRSINSSKNNKTYW